MIITFYKITIVQIMIIRFLLLKKLKFYDGALFYKFLQEKSNIEGFKLSSNDAKDDTFIKVNCWKHSKSNINPCDFFINIQAYNSKTPNKHYKITKAFLQHNHPINSKSFAHCIINDETKNVIKI